MNNFLDKLHDIIFYTIVAWVFIAITVTAYEIIDLHYKLENGGIACVNDSV